MNTIYIAAILSLALFANAYDDGQWRGEGLLESQDWAGRGYIGAPLALSAGVLNGGLIGGGLVGVPGVIGGGLVGVPGVINGGLGLARGIWAYGGAPIGVDGRVVDTPEVAIAKSAHLAAKINVVNGVNAW